MNRNIEKRIEGGNSIVNLYTDGDCKLVEKIYKKQNNDWMQRLKREVNALKLLKEINIEYVPQLISYDENEGIIKTSFLEGQKIKDGELSQDMLRQIIEINTNLEYTKIIEKSKNIEYASDSILNPKEFIYTLESQLRKLKEGLCLDDKSKERKEFIEELRKNLQTSQKKFIQEGLKCEKVFSFSDYGLHNCINKKGKLYFFDFEHSGWDDPSKGYCDWILRPNGGLGDKKAKELIQAISMNDKTGGILERMSHIMPVIGIKWMVIYIKYRKKLGEQIDIEKIDNEYRILKKKIDSFIG